MTLTISLAMLFSVSAATCFAGTWSGVLVDAKCYAAEQRNVNPTDTETAVDIDKGYEIRYCHPKTKTKSFAVVDAYGGILKLDSAGDAKASEFVRNAGKKHAYDVAVRGEKSGNVIQVDSISAWPGR